jgi:hypothetical protein
LWHDLSRWKVVASAVAPKTIAAFVAISPSGDYAAQCELPVKALRDSTASRSSDGELQARILPARAVPQTYREFTLPFNSPYFGHAHNTCAIRGLPCIGHLYVSARRMPTATTQVRLESVSGGPDRTGGAARPSTMIEVKDGWLVAAWADGKKTPCAQARATAYDARGHVLSVIANPDRPCTPG